MTQALIVVRENGRILAKLYSGFELQPIQVWRFRNEKSFLSRRGLEVEANLTRTYPVDFRKLQRDFWEAQRRWRRDRLQVRTT